MRDPQYQVELAGTALKELKIETQYYALDDVMFPFKPTAAPSTMDSDAGDTCTITQSEDGLWYASIEDYGQIFDKEIINVCTNCKNGTFTS